ncbi:MAG: Shikimate dehydrogenase [Thermodesulfobacteriota bacterium]|nr:Shikimate dehydrogenase [Thermodesulfobacteriota bacterium]
MIFDSNSSVYAVFGDPVSHTLSPVMHNRAFEVTGFKGIYLAFGVKNIKNALFSVRTLGIKGASITIPHKIEVMKYLDEVDYIASKIGAVNTITNNGGSLKGYNSDGLGAKKSLSEKTVIKGKKIAVIGAGGAARAVGFCIKKEGGRVTVISRDPDKGKRLAGDLTADYRPLNDIGGMRCDILINATPVGMTPDNDGMPIERKYLVKGMVVMDIVYNPLKTRLLSEAEKAGCIIVDGVSMFVHQGAFQFELWTGIKAPVDIMKRAVLDALIEREK